MADDARHGARDALRAPRRTFSLLGYLILWVQVALAFALYFPLANVAAYLFSLLTHERWGGALMLTGAAIGALAGLLAARNAYMRFGTEGEDSHGSARFAFGSELRADLAIDTGLIVGRELRGGKLLRYDVLGAASHPFSR